MLHALIARHAGGDKGSLPSFDSTNLLSELPAAQLWGSKEVDEKLLGTYFNYFIKIKYMPAVKGAARLTTPAVQPPQPPKSLRSRQSSRKSTSQYPDGRTFGETVTDDGGMFDMDF